MRLVQTFAALALMGESLAFQPAPPGQRTSSSDRVTVPFSDPSRPGTVKLRMIQGSVSVKGGGGREVVIDASGDLNPRPRSSSRTPSRADGLRRLTQPSGLTVEEEANVVSITARPNDDGHVEIQVPARTNLQLSLVNGGDIVVQGVEGDIEVNNVNGGITLTDVAGTVVAHSVNDDVKATVRQVSSDKPMAFTSLNGEVDVTLPASLKANLRLRSDQGDVYTDFDIQTTPAPPASGAPGRRADRDRDSRRPNNRDPRDLKDKSRGAFELRVDRAIYGTVNGGGPEVELRTFNGDVYLRKGR